MYESDPTYFEDFDFNERLGVIHVEGEPAGLAGDSVIVTFIGKPNRASRKNPITRRPSSPTSARCGNATGS